MWNYSAQICTAVVQLAYAAITSHLLPDDGFGLYGAAFISAQFVNILATAGLPQTIGRMREITAGRLLGLLAFAVAVGMVAAAALYLTAGAWGVIWAAPGSVPLTRLLALTSFLTPLWALSGGFSFRRGRFRELAVVTLTANLSGMVIALIAVLMTRSPAALTLSPICSELLIVTLILGRNAREFRGAPELARTLRDVGYSFRVAVSGILIYSASNLPRVAVSRAFGAGSLGQWNRADAFTTAPFFQLQNALVQAVYPEFRHDRDSPTRARQVWADLLIMVAWVSMPLGTLGAIVGPPAIDLLLGQRWQLAAQLVIGLSLIGGLQCAVALLVSALEALGKFPLIWAGWGVNLAANVAGSAVGAATGQMGWVLVGIAGGALAMHALQVAVSIRAGLIDGKRLAAGYLQVVLGSALTAALAAAAVQVGLRAASAPIVSALLCAVLLVSIALLWRSRRRLWPLRLAHEYGLIGGGPAR